MTWAEVGTAWLIVGMVLAEGVRWHETVRTHVKTAPENGARLYASVALGWPFVILYIAGHAMLTGRRPEE